MADRMMCVSWGSHACFLSDKFKKLSASLYKFIPDGPGCTTVFQQHVYIYNC